MGHFKKIMFDLAKSAGASMGNLVCAEGDTGM